MSAAYDTYDYPAYWKGRKYEHESEVIAIKDFLKQIPKISNVIDIGAGFGRLTDAYAFRAKKVILTDPSARLLKIARKKYSNKKYKIVQSSLYNLPKKIKRKTADLAIMVRVIHHMEDLDAAFSDVNKIVNKNGYFILEFANKRHLKATLKEFLKGNTTFILDIFPEDIRSKRHKKQNTIPFVNYHPEIVKQKLREHGFTIIQTKSVSNLRSIYCKKLLSLSTLLSLEKRLQNMLARFNFGPSIFILAKKTG